MDHIALQTLQTAKASSALQALNQQRRDLNIAAKAERLDDRTLAKIDAAAKDYESVFIAEMLDHMFKDVPMGGGFGAESGQGAQEIYKQHLVREYASSLADRGGVGLAQHIRGQLIELQSSSNLQ